MTTTIRGEINAAVYTPPAAADFTALNGASLADILTDIGPAVATNAPSTGGAATNRMKGGEELMGYVSGTRTVIAGIISRASMNDYAASGIYFKESGTGRITFFTCGSVGGKVTLGGADLSGPDGATFVRQPTGEVDTPIQPPGAKWFMKATYDGADMKMYFSLDMVSWVQWATVSKTEYFAVAPDTWGWAANANTGSGDVDVSCFSWKVT